MTPVLRVILPTLSVTELPLGTVGTKLTGAVTYGTNSDYITDNLIPPVGALYVAKMDDKGAITVLTAKSAALTPTHSYLGWPIPA